MYKKYILAIVAVAVGVAATTPAFAQEKKPMGLSVRLGLFFPSSDQAKDVGKNWFGGGIEYKLGDLNYGAQKGHSASYSISIDTFSKGGFGTTPILLNYIARKENIYYKGGIGIGLLKLPVFGGSDNKSQFAYQLAIGYDFNKGNVPYFAEIAWLGSTKSDVNGIGIFGGVRF